MNYSLYNYIVLNSTDIKNLYKKYNVNASKKFGQNFLIDQNILNNIIDVSEINGKDVIEIGPGLGSLTHYLIKDAKTVTSYEIDEDMIKVLKEEIKSENFNLIEGDFLNANFDYDGKRTIVANIPYNITSDILFKLFENSKKIDRAVIMMQKEVAERLNAPVGSKSYGKLTISAQHFSEIKYEFTVPENSFVPAPKVKSAVVTFNFKNIDFENSNDFLKFVKQCFSMRRKTLFNNLKNFLGHEIARKLVDYLNMGDAVRPQELSYTDFINLFNNTL